MTVKWLMPDFKKGERPLVGTFLQIPYPGLGECFKGLPFDFLCIEGEHSPFALEEIHHFARAAAIADKALIVRLSEASAKECAQVLDAGVAGIIVPRVNSAEEAKSVARASRYPPRGSRGLGPGRASLYGGEIGEYLAQAREKTFVGIQVETAEGVQNLEEILTVQDIDMIFVGPADLAVSMTGTLAPEGAEVDAAIQEILRKSRAAGYLTGIFATTPEQGAHYASQGADLIILGSDLMYLRQGAAKNIRNFYKGCPETTARTPNEDLRKEGFAE